jgi:tRNA (cmo5U34)-methyltransferase
MRQASRKPRVEIPALSATVGRGEKMKNSKSEWQTPELTRTFLNGVRRAIPGADLQLSVVGKIAQLWCKNPSKIIDLGCGDGILGRLLLDLFPAAQGIFIDFSDPMLHAARVSLSHTPQATLVKADFSSSQWVNAIQAAPPFDIIISGFAIHHQPDERKKQLYSEIYRLLSPGGLFLNLEHVASASSAATLLFDEFFVDHLYAFHAVDGPARTREDIADTYYNRPDKKENILASVTDQCEWLRRIGFEDVDCFFKIFELALFGGRKLLNVL